MRARIVIVVALAFALACADAAAAECSCSSTSTCDGEGSGSSNCAPPLTINSSVCDDGRACTANVFDASTGACAYPPLSRATNCSNACYAEGTPLWCDGVRGACVSDNVTACKGMCTADSVIDTGSLWHVYEHWNLNFSAPCSPFIFPVRPYYIMPLYERDGLYITQDEGIGFPTCIAQVCTLVTLQATAGVYETESGRWLESAMSMLLPCDDMLDANDPAYACIRTTSIDVDSGFASWYLNQRNSGRGLPNKTFVGRLCAYQYACAAYNMSVFSDPINFAPPGGPYENKKRAGAAETRVPLSHPAGVSMPRMTSAMLPTLLDAYHRRQTAGK
jgi:hypothetical protein